MSGFMSTVEANQVKTKADKPKIQMTTEQLKDFMSQIEAMKEKKEWRKVIQLLKIIKISYTSIECIESTNAEKFLRKLVTSIDCDPFHPDK